MLKLLFDFGSNASDAIKSATAYLKAHPEASPSAVAAHILTQTKGWDPAHHGKKLLTAPLRSKLATALADLAYNLRAAETGKDLV